jgi:polyphosphate kinase 2 (PPK2 family)
VSCDGLQTQNNLEQGAKSMLDKIDLSKQIPKKDYKLLMPKLRNRLYDLQKASWDAGIPVIILFEGWDAAGKGTSIQYLTRRLDPRGFKLYPIRPARTYEKKRPWLWRFWLKIPGCGEWAIFDRSWYGRVLVERVEQLVPELDWRRAYRDIVDFERTLADDGYILIKFFLHISKKEQRSRFDALSSDPLMAWKVEPEDWERHNQYDEWLRIYEEMFERTDTEWGAWTIVEATDRYYTRIKIFQSLIGLLEERLHLLDALPQMHQKEREDGKEERIEEVSPITSESEVFQEPVSEEEPSLAFDPRLQDASEEEPLP